MVENRRFRCIVVNYQYFWLYVTLDMIAAYVFEKDASCSTTHQGLFGFTAAKWADDGYSDYHGSH